MPKGGKRQGSGRKEGSKDSLSRDDIAVLEPRVINLLTSILDAAEKLPIKELNRRIMAFKEIAPYIIRKQPTAIDGGDGKPIGVKIIKDNI
jgi:hypothetical protein